MSILSMNKSSQNESTNEYYPHTSSLKIICIIIKRNKS